jgi:maltose alpha-D-glucosyltransferase/alpha-amylase
VKPLASELLGRQSDALNKFEAIRRRLIDVSRIRVHGDLHLGQVLYTGQDFAVIDFEGEPARPVAERRIKRSAISDVAGMIRSYDYATETAMRQTVERGLVQAGSPAEAHLAEWSRLWRAWAQAELLKAYRACAAGQPFFPDDPEDVEILLSCYVLEKAIYELRYELGSRPTWVPIPLRGILSLLDTDGSGLRC